MTKTKIVLADDHQFLLDGIISILSELPHLEIGGTAQNGVELMNLVAQEQPNLVIMDLNMPGLDGVQCLRKIKTAYRGTKVLILTNYSQPELVDQVKKLNADGYLIKNSSATELKDAIATIISGGIHFPSAAELKHEADDSFFFDEFLKKYQLTKREVGIIRLICREMSTKEIAASLFLSELTINTHRRNILKKLQVKNVAGLVNFAKENQLF